MNRRCRKKTHVMILESSEDQLKTAPTPCGEMQVGRRKRCVTLRAAGGGITALPGRRRNDLHVERAIVTQGFLIGSAPKRMRH